ncbi:MAG: HAD-IB family hydrolase [Sandaracinaceae bacterium]|nr:HAD-IB family hydrolase [Sandaracinaceae bacterium]
MPMRAALFDMDKTLVRANTGIRYARWRVRRGEMPTSELARVLGWSLQYTFGLVDAEAVSRYAARTLTGVDESSFAEECRGWFREDVLPLVADEARREVERMRREGHVLAILSGSSPYAAGPLADELGIPHVLCTRLVVEGGRFTGEVVSPLAFGHGKVTLAEAWAREHGVDLAQSVFYSDSISDLPMLERVGRARVINPDPRLRWTARRRRWPIEHW